jgi:hypothetical protein
VLKNRVAMWLEGKQRSSEKPPIKSGRTEVPFSAALVPSVGTTNTCNNDLGLGQGFRPGLGR